MICSCSAIHSWCLYILSFATPCIYLGTRRLLFLLPIPHFPSLHTYTSTSYHTPLSSSFPLFLSSTIEFDLDYCICVSSWSVLHPISVLAISRTGVAFQMNEVILSLLVPPWLIVFVEEPCADIMSGTHTYPLTNWFCVHIWWDKAALTPILGLEFSQPGSTNLSQNIEDGGQMVDWSWPLGKPAGPGSARLQVWFPVRQIGRFSGYYMSRVPHCLALAVHA